MKIFALLFALIFSGTAFADGAATEEEMLVTGTRSARAASAIPHSSTVLEGEELSFYKRKLEKKKKA